MNVFNALNALNASDSSDATAIAAHVLRHLARAGARGRLVRLDQLAADIGVRRDEVRDVVTRLHAEGHVNAARMKLTLTGLAIAASMRGCVLRDVRDVRDVRAPRDCAPEAKVA